MHLLICTRGIKEVHRINANILSILQNELKIIEKVTNQDLNVWEFIYCYLPDVLIEVMTKWGHIYMLW